MSEPGCGFPDEAKRILEGLEKAKSQTAAEALEERIVVCEHASALSNGQLVMQCKFSELKAHLSRTEGLWEVYPFPLQVRVCVKFAMESMKDLCVEYLNKLGDKQAKKKLKVEPSEGAGSDKCSASASKGSAAATDWKGQVVSCLGCIGVEKELLNHRMYHFQFDGKKPHINDSIGLMMHALGESSLDLEAELEQDLAADETDKKEKKKDGDKAKEDALQAVRTAVQAGFLVFGLVIC